MNHQTYVAERSARDPRFADERSAAIAEIHFGELLVNRRSERGMSLTDLAEVTGILETRLDEIEAGDAMTLHEALWLIHALEISVSIGPEFTISSTVAATGNQAAKPTRIASRSDPSPKAASA